MSQFTSIESCPLLEAQGVFPPLPANDYSVNHAPEFSWVVDLGVPSSQNSPYTSGACWNKLVAFDLISFELYKNGYTPRVIPIDFTTTNNLNEQACDWGFYPTYLNRLPQFLYTCESQSSAWISNSFFTFSNYSSLLRKLSETSLPPPSPYVPQPSPSPPSPYVPQPSPPPPSPPFPPTSPRPSPPPPSPFAGYFVTSSLPFTFGQILSTNEDVMVALDEGKLIAAAIYGTSVDLYAYAGGILTSSHCSSTVNVDTPTLIVGYARIGSSGFWIIRNYWGVNWGVQGYAYLDMASRACNIKYFYTYSMTRPPPTPPPPLQPPPPLPPTVATVSTTVVVAGSVSDFTATVRTELTQAVATEAGVPPAAVTLNVAAASVRLTFTISLPSAAAATNATNSLANVLATPSTASGFLTTSSYTASVVSIVDAPQLLLPPLPPPPMPPPPPSLSNQASGSSQGDPHLQFAHGGVADFRGYDKTFFNILSAPGFSFACRTDFATFMLKHGIQIDGSFFTSAIFSILDEDEIVRITTEASSTVFANITHKKNMTTLHRWSEYKTNDVLIEVRYLSVIVSNERWKVSIVRKPVYNFVSGPRWRFDFSIESKIAESEMTCYPHGIIGQSFDNDQLAVNGKLDQYDKKYVKTSAMAEGAIEGNASDYQVNENDDTLFKFSRFKNTLNDICPTRNISLLSSYFNPRLHTTKENSLSPLVNSAHATR